VACARPRFAADGAISRVLAAVIAMPPPPATRGRLASVAARDGAQRRLYVREAQPIVILDTAGTLLEGVDGFRLPTEQRIRS
jgi:hypothetical protein